MIEVIVLSVALAMDAFAVSIGLGSKSEKDRLTALALTAGVWFGLFQGVMPLIGYLAGHGVLGWVEDYAPAIAFGLLVLIGGKMIWESFGEGVEDEITRITHKVMLMLAIATSIDAMAAGFSLTLLDVNPFIACFMIAVITLLFSVAGVFIGFRSGTWLESRAELFGGVVLILIGFKILLF